jgi:hypothetical protein
VSVAGLSDLENVFKQLQKGVANRIARPGLAKAGRLAVKKIKAAIPSRYKGVRKAIKSRSIKTKFNSGVAGVKVGAGVSRKRGEKSERSGKKGVGIGARNVHWWFLGTKERRTKNGRRTGRMPVMTTGVTEILNSARGEMVDIIRKGIQQGIDKEVAKLAKKRL